MRVQSNRPHTLKGGELGYWHDLKDKPVKYVPRPKAVEAPKIDAEAMMQEWHSKTKKEWVYQFAKLLGITPLSLFDLEVAWSSTHEAWAFPMTGISGETCGIRLRYESGRKLAVTGSRAGIFLPKVKLSTLIETRTAYVVEGPTDTAALLDIGMFSIGRPSCSGGVEEVKSAIKRSRLSRAVIVADNDGDKYTTWGQKFNPGYDGAQRLAEQIGVPCCVMSLPCKDAREFVNLGGTREVLESLTKNLLWQNL